MHAQWYNQHVSLCTYDFFVSYIHNPQNVFLTKAGGTVKGFYKGMI